MSSKSSIDNFKPKLNEYRNKLNKIKSDYKLDNPKTSLSNEQKGNLKYTLQKLKLELTKFKEQYLASNYRSVLSEFEDSNRKDELSEIMSNIDMLINLHCKGNYEITIKEEDYKDKEFTNPYEQLQYQQKKLIEQDEIIDNIIATNEENKEIGKAVKHNLNEQNKKITQIGHTLDKTQNSADKLNAKVVDLILDSSFWKLYLIIVVLAFILIWLIL